MKIVLNNDWGTFDLSAKGFVRYFELKGQPYEMFTRGKDSTIDFTSFTHITELPEDHIYVMFFNNLEGEIFLNSEPIQRNDPALIQTVEELGKDVNTDYSDLVIIEIPDDVDWIVQGYDGCEWVAEKHRTWRVPNEGEV
jgi:hypothetical protein